MPSSVVDIETPHGLARAHLRVRADAAGTVMLGHGAGGGVQARDLAAAARAAESLEWTVILVEQPYRVAGRRSPAPARQLDAAWLAVVERLRSDKAITEPYVAGGRSSGARVACRTAEAAGAAAVLCLAFPLQPPGRPGAPSRLGELDGVEVPTLVIQGEHDPFGMPPSAPGRTVAEVAGNHSLTADLDPLAAAVHDWLARVVA